MMQYPEKSSIDRSATLVAGLLIITLSGFVYHEFDLRHALLLSCGVGLGFALLQASFGFTGGWRRFVRERDASGVRAQLVLVAVTSLLFFPLLGYASGDMHLSAATAPIGVAVLLGAFIFGIGMQLGGGCGSGTLFTVGQGQVDMLITFVCFIVGATVGSAHLAWWLTLPSMGEISLINSFGWYPALLVTLVAIIALYLLVRRFERPVTTTDTPQKFTQTLFHGHWPWWWGVIALVLLNLATMLLAGHPWTITYAFGLWGAKLWAAVGGEPHDWTYWSSGYPSQSLQQSVLADTTSLMDFGLILGALLAAALANRVAPAMRLSSNRIITAIIGGLLMGYGARLAFGCNIGALLAGISTGSVHGWLWLVAAFSGTVLGVHVRVWTKLDKPWRTTS
jgi:uncharacterized protein